VDEFNASLRVCRHTLASFAITVTIKLLAGLILNPLSAVLAGQLTISSYDTADHLHTN
jgi:hypothetical protein